MFEKHLHGFRIPEFVFFDWIVKYFTIVLQACYEQEFFLLLNGQIYTSQSEAFRQSLFNVSATNHDTPVGNSPIGNLESRTLHCFRNNKAQDLA